MSTTHVVGDDEVDERTEIFGDYDWFAQGTLRDDPELRALYGSDEYDMVLQALREAFPPARCRTMVENGNGSIVVSLFNTGLSHFTRETLALGSDLARVPAGPGRQHIVARLRDISSHAAARLEVGIWAALLRAGINVLHESQYRDAIQKPGTPTTACADFIVVHEGVRIAMEVKAMGSALADRNTEVLREYLRDAAFQLQPTEDQAVDVVLAVDDVGLALITESKHETFCDLVQNTFVERVSKLDAGIAEHEVPPFGRLRVQRSPDDGFGIDVEGLQPRTPGDHARRVAKIAADAAPQVNAITDADLRVVVVATGTSVLAASNPDMKALHHALAQRSDTLEAIDALVVLNSFIAVGGWTTKLLVVQKGHPAFTSPPPSWLAALGGYRYSR